MAMRFPAGFNFEGAHARFSSVGFFRSLLPCLVASLPPLFSPLLLLLT